MVKTSGATDKQSRQRRKLTDNEKANNRARREKKKANENEFRSSMASYVQKKPAAVAHCNPEEAPPNLADISEKQEPRIVSLG
jgi:hypothetical protein